jgi:Arc/MetJ-type ribon-helix-helix transcriptional regulator
MKTLTVRLPEPLVADIEAAIHGAGAFRMFRSTIRRLGIEKSWYRFREEALAGIARDWLEAHELSYR